MLEGKYWHSTRLLLLYVPSEAIDFIRMMWGGRSWMFAEVLPCFQWTLSRLDFLLLSEMLPHTCRNMHTHIHTHAFLKLLALLRLGLPFPGLTSSHLFLSQCMWQYISVRVPTHFPWPITPSRIPLSQSKFFMGSLIALSLCNYSVLAPSFLN